MATDGGIDERDPAVVLISHLCKAEADRSSKQSTCEDIL